MTNEVDKLAANIEHLSIMLERYAHRWNENPSQRMMQWVDDLGDDIYTMKTEHGDAWCELCDKHGWDYTTNAYDALA